MKEENEAAERIKQDRQIRSICLFCASRKGNRERYAETTRSIGHLLAKEKITAVTGGGKVGLMGVVADAVLEKGGEIVGVIPKALATKELMHTGLTDLHQVSSLQERKKLMCKLADAFVILPGGLGTLDELSEVLTWSYLGLHAKPIGILNVDGFFDSLLMFLNHVAAEDMMWHDLRELFVVETDPERLLTKLRNFAPPARKTWITPEDM